MTTKIQGFQTIEITEVAPWPNLNPRIGFDQEALEELAESIRVDGLLQPIAVAPAGLQKDGVKYWVFAGERRLRACQILATHRERLKVAAPQTIDVIVHDVDEATAHRLAGVENLERNDLTAIEEAIWLERELELTGLNQKGLGETLGRSQAWVANRVRLLTLPAPIRTLIHEGVVAPAMARDTLLRFTKLEKADASKVWKHVTAAIKRAAKEESPVTLGNLQGAVYEGIGAAGAVIIAAGHQFDRKSNASLNVSKAALEAFKKEHGARCFRAVYSTWNATESDYTLAVDEWAAVCAAALAETSSRSSTGGVSKKKLEAPKLSPTAGPVDFYELQREYGHDNVIEFDQIVDPSKIDPSHVARVTRHGKDELAYIGPNVRALKGARTRAKTPVRAEVAEKVQSGRMDEAAALTASQVLTGLLEAVVETGLFGTLHGMIEAELGRAVDLNRYNLGEAQIADIEIPAKSLKRIAAGIAHVAITKRHYWDLDVAIDEAVEKRVTRDTSKARRAWLAEHAPKEDK